jgi:hypothetical protein
MALKKLKKKSHINMPFIELSKRLSVDIYHSESNILDRRNSVDNKEFSGPKC